MSMYTDSLKNEHLFTFVAYARPSIVAWCQETATWRCHVAMLYEVDEEATDCRAGHFLAAIQPCIFSSEVQKYFSKCMPISKSILKSKFYSANCSEEPVTVPKL